MKGLVACEESQRVCIAFREKGHEAYSCDIMDCSGGHPEWHIKGDVLNVLNPTELIGVNEQGIVFETVDGLIHDVEKWDMIIVFHHHSMTHFKTIWGNVQLFLMTCVIHLLKWKIC